MRNISEYFIVFGIVGLRVWGSLRDAHAGLWVSCRAGCRGEAHPWAQPLLPSSHKPGAARGPGTAPHPAQLPGGRGEQEAGTREASG